MEEKRIRHAVGAIVVHQGQYLLIHKVRLMDTVVPVAIPGEWNFPSGGLKAEDASVAEAVLRELREETGSHQYTLLTQFIEPLRFTFPRHQNYPYTHQETTMFLAEYTGDGTDLMPQDEEIDQVAFFTPDEVLTHIRLEESHTFFGQYLQETVPYMSHHSIAHGDFSKPDAIRLFEEVWRETSSVDIFDRDLWKSHSYHVADGAARIAEKLPSADPNRAFALGLLHDIGKSIDYRPKKHALTGYQFLLARGDTEAALIALTHDFPTKEFEIHRQEGFLNAEELDVVIQTLSPYEYTLYDRLIQVCDVISLPDGHVLMEKRMMAAILRNGGLSDSLKQIIIASYSNMAFIEEQLGQSIYAVLPDVIANTF